MGELPRQFGDYAVRAFAAETRGGLAWWDTCITSAIMDLCRVDGFTVALSGIARVLREGEDVDWIVGGVTPKAAIQVTLEWLKAEVDPLEVELWLRAGCWHPDTAVKLVAAGIRPNRLLDGERRPIHWIEVGDGERVPLATAVTEWSFPVPEAVRMVTGWAYEVPVVQD